MEWLWHGPFPLVFIIVLCIAIGFVIQWLNRDVNNILDGKGMPDQNGRPQLGTEAVDREAFARELNRQRLDIRPGYLSAGEIKAMNFYPEQNTQEKDRGYAERYHKGAVYPVKGKEE